MSRKSYRRCFFGCKGKSQLFSPPKDESTRKQWLEFISAEKPSAKLCLCAGHFTEDSFTNKGQYDGGFASHLLLKPGVVPSLKRVHHELHHDSEPKASPSQLTAAAGAHQTKPRRRVSVATQTVRGATSLGTQFSASSSGVSIGTQLSYRTLKEPMRSKGTQATVRCASVGTEITVRNKHFTRSSSQTKPSRARPAKRPRLDLLEKEEEEVREEEHSRLKTDSTLQYGKSSTSQMSETESTPHNEAKYVVIASGLRELFQTCPLCKQDCDVQQQKLGTCVAFRQKCTNCQYAKRWQSQPVGKSAPVGDLKMSAGV
ncbi:peroxynitrite isomerase THAP4 [Cheilinus undulatus]|uniref:peroxynitrite isomerase THAP4 n=1 Tax=Cheilinus undulatus TaxID=241271 RepID=UPI001BD41F7A|nr:peroxynitrite isomerase THAP4 [Cheilinus undulatus]